MSTPVIDPVDIPGDRIGAVSIQNLSKTYPVSFARLKRLLRRKTKPPVEALRDISFEVYEGEIFGLIGPNGAGKTTLIKTIATLIQPTNGSVTIHGYDSVRDDEQVRRKVGLAGAEERSFYWRLTAAQNLMFFSRLYGLGSRAAKEKIDKLFELFELKELANRRFAELSTGNKQRLSIARAMLADPPVVLLDEPTRSLDPIAAARMREVIKALTKDNDRRVTVFLTSHNLNEVEELCHRVAIIGNGRIHALDSPQNLRAIHTTTEHVSILVKAGAANKIEDELRAAFTDHFLTLGRTGSQHGWTIKFSRARGDDALDKVLTVLHDAGAIIQAVDTQRASLLDVLESYEETAAGKDAQS
jgi:ABC-2 type transport system ATP-binding protein